MPPYHFVDINRTGSTSIRAALQDESQKHLHAVERRWRSDDWEEAWTFAVIRNPWTKVVSEFAHQWPTYHGNFTLDREGFERWVVARYVEKDRVTTHRGSFHHRLWWPQWNWVSDHEKVIVDTLFSFEDLEGAWGEISSRLGIDRDLPHHASGSQKVKDRLPAYGRDLYTDRAARIIRNHFAEDFGRLL